MKVGDVERLADAVATITVAQPGVARLAAGHVGEIGTYLPGRRISGVRITDTSVEVQVVVHWMASLPAMAAALQDELASIVNGRIITVRIEDIELLDDDTPAEHDEVPWTTTTS